VYVDSTVPRYVASLYSTYCTTRPLLKSDLSHRQLSYKKKYYAFPSLSRSWIHREQYNQNDRWWSWVGKSWCCSCLWLSTWNSRSRGNNFMGKSSILFRSRCCIIIIISPVSFCIRAYLLDCIQVIFYWFEELTSRTYASYSFSTPFYKRTRSSKSSTVQKLLSIAVVLICGLLIAVAVLGMIAFNPKDVSNYSDLFVSVYMVLFGALLLTYEFMWWISVPAINKSLRKNFGFLYGVLGKSIFIIFVAFLNFGLQKQVTVKYLTVGTGIAWFVVAGLHIFLYFWKPELFGTYHAPAAGLDSPV